MSTSDRCFFEKPLARLWTLRDSLRLYADTTQAKTAAVIERDMSSMELMTELLEAGVHFGHQTKRWNPKMKPFIFEKTEFDLHH